ncbi:excalibur calcium-binding domain-containing protein [Bacillus cytotoxicus]
MFFWSNLSTILFWIAIILLILCIIASFKKNGKAMKYGRPAVVCFMISFLIFGISAAETEHPIVNFFANLCFILFIFFLVLSILSVIKKTGMAKKQFFITGILFILFGVLSAIATPSTPKVNANKKKVATEKTDKKLTKQNEVDEQARKQQEEQRQAEEQARKQQEEEQRQAEEQARKQQEEEQRQAEEQARKQQEEQRQAEEQAHRQQTNSTENNNSHVYYKNCKEVKNAGKAPLYAGQPGYSRKLDRDGDGVACER